MPASTVAAALLLVLALAGGCSGSRTEDFASEATVGTPYLEAAVAAGRWLESTLAAGETDTIWPDDALRLAESPTVGIDSGVAGKVLFYIELEHATREPSYLQEVRRGADYLLAALSEGEIDAGLYRGLAGVGYTLHRAFVVTGDGSYLEGLHDVVRRIAEAARPVGDGQVWNGFNDVLQGGAGIGFFLLYVTRELDGEVGAGTTPAEARALAIGAGDALLGRAIDEHGGLTWKVGDEMDFVLPNFSHGAAGIGTFLAALGAETGEARFTEGARRAAIYLRAIANTDDGVFLVPYGVPNEGFERPYDVGWAHGPAGTARLFFALGERGEDRQAMAIVEACARAISRSGIPGPPAAADFGNDPFDLDTRFGIAGVANFFSDLYRFTGDSRHLRLAHRLADALIAAGSIDGGRLHWQTTRHDFMPEGGTPAAFTGYYYGAAGYGLALLRVHLAIRGEDPIVFLPDNPFGSR